MAHKDSAFREAVHSWRSNGDNGGVGKRRIGEETSEGDREAIGGLSPAQREAAEHIYGPAIVVAGPGSGKTHTTVCRLKTMVGDKGIDPASILSITFTRYAALQMRSRAMALLGDDASIINFSTFHSLFFKILKHTYRFDRDNIIGNIRKTAILKDVLRGLGIDPLSGSKDLNELLNEFSICKCSVEKKTVPSKVLEEKDFLRVFEAYEKKCSALRLIDFDDMAVKCRELFISRPEVLKQWQELYKFILVDEFQDIDPLQFEIVRLLSQKHRNLFVVGDDDQAIYSFRGSSPKIMLQFGEYYPDAHRIMLNENYRSGESIIKAAGAVIAENKERIEKKASAVNDMEAQVRILQYKDRDEEMKNIVSEIERGGDYSSYAVLLRTNGLCEEMVGRLIAAGIPYRCKERISNIYDSGMARDILDYLRLAGGVRLRSTMYRVMNHPYRFISRESIRGNEFSFQQMKAYHRGEPCTLKNIERLEKDLVRIRTMNPYSAIHYILYGMGYMKYLKDRALKEGGNISEQEEQVREIQERARGYRSHGAYLEAVEAYSRELAIAASRNSERGEKSDRSAVTVMTLHASKGLEFKKVFLPSVNEGVIPGHRIVTERELEEERRLFYVGMTRASERLNISYCRESTTGPLNPSRFLTPLNQGTVL